MSGQNTVGLTQIRYGCDAKLAIQKIGGYEFTSGLFHGHPEIYHCPWVSEAIPCDYCVCIFRKIYNVCIKKNLGNILGYFFWIEQSENNQKCLYSYHASDLFVTGMDIFKTYFPSWQINMSTKTSVTGWSSFRVHSLGTEVHYEAPVKLSAYRLILIYVYKTLVPKYREASEQDKGAWPHWTVPSNYGLGASLIRCGCGVDSYHHTIDLKPFSGTAFTSVNDFCHWWRMGWWCSSTFEWLLRLKLDSCLD